jgi:hypothetical protein
MNVPRLIATLALVTPIALTGCCGADEQHAVNVSTAGLTLVRDGVTTQITSSARATVPPVSPPTFQFVYNTLQGNTIGDGVALSVGGNDPVSDELITFALALPMALRDGDVYTVGATYTIEPGIENDPRLFGAYDLEQPNQAEVAFNISTYTFPPATYTTTYRAVTSTGTIRVLERERGRLELMVELSLVDAAGKTATVTGQVHANTETYTPPCYS